MKYDFVEDGLVIANLFSTGEIDKLTDDVGDYICNKLGVEISKDISKYHKWYKEGKIERKIALSAANRHFRIAKWKEMKIEERLRREIEKSCRMKDIKIWNEGYGEIAYRLIRPGFKDGYPASKKSWGPAGKVISVTIPLIGFSKYESQSFIIGSHKKEYESYMPKDQKFCSDELRLKQAGEYTFTELEPSKGDIIIFHWDTIHSEK